MHHRIDTEADVAAGLEVLIAADPRLAKVAAAAGPLPLRRRPGGFAGLAGIVVSQQLSTASASAIWGRLAAAYEPAALRAQAYTARLAYKQSIASYIYNWKQLVAIVGLRQLPLSEVAGRLAQG